VLGVKRPSGQRSTAFSPVAIASIAMVSGSTKTEVYILDRSGAEQSIIIGGSLIAPMANPDEMGLSGSEGV
jgi:hypothetical protein